MTLPVIQMADPAASAGRPLYELLSGPDRRVLVLDASKDQNRKVTALLLPAAGTVPVLAVKAPTTDIAAANIEREASILSFLQGTIRDPAVLATLPRVIAMASFDGRPALITTALSGVPMLTSYHHWRHTAAPRRVSRDFTAVAAWLRRFQAATARRPAQPIDLVGNDIRAQLTARFADEPGLETALSQLDEVRRRLERFRTPKTAVHGDLWMGNLLSAGGMITGAVDWEFAARCGEPVRDLVHVALTYALYLDRHTGPGRRVAGHRSLRADRWGAGVHYAVSGSGWFPDLFRDFLRTGLKRLGAPETTWLDAVLAGVAEVAAIADDERFARHHFELFSRLAVTATLGPGPLGRRAGP
jgi:aminoglycoside phosphotransferase